ncbi:MAG: HDOD domain-containing protein [Armatimonadetes bacterium]|nr:HDOD domain-containing protein [Armatimonadota bacterium]
MHLFVVRQPIFNRWKRVVGYEVLFHSIEKAEGLSVNHEQAGKWVIDAHLHLFRPMRLTCGKLAFIPAPRPLILQDLITTLPPSQTVLEVDAEENSDEVVSACFRLKVTGYPIAVRGFLPWSPVRPLVAIANILKVDFEKVTGAERARAVSVYATPNRKMLAEKIESAEEFAEAERMGYDYFQGSFFCQPETLSAKLLTSHQLTYFRIMQLLGDPNFDLSHIEQVLKTDPSLSFKLLRYINSAAIGVRHRISSLKQALVLLGECLLRRWLLIAVSTLLLEKKPYELLVTALVRGHMCEQIAAAAGLPPEPDPFLVGLFSVLDALLDQPMTEILEELPLNPELKDALLRAPTPLGWVYSLVLAYERADWQTVRSLANFLKVPETELAVHYERSVRWADHLFSRESITLLS